MDFGDFRKAVAKAATAVAPAYKAGGVAVLGVVAPPAAPFAAMTPPATFLAFGQPSLLLIPEYRGEVDRELTEDVDYAKLGELAALAALKKGT